jgi:signal transduction histidine kinase
MKRARVRSITVELIILFAAVVILSQIIALGHRYLDRTETLTAFEALQIADRVTGLTRLFEDASAESRPRLTQHFQDSNMPAVWSPRSWTPVDADQDSDTRLLRVLLGKSLPSVGLNDIRVGYRHSADESDIPELNALIAIWHQSEDVPQAVQPIVSELLSEPNLLVSVKLSDGTWLNFVPFFVQAVDFWPIKTMLLLALLVAAVLALSIWSIRRLTTPFRVFASAAEQLGKDPNAAPIPEHGPLEVRVAIAAFNTMQRRLNRFIEDRTQMLAAVSHDLRTPITRLRLRAEFVEDKAQHAKMLADLDEMQAMVEATLSFAKDDVSSEQSVCVDLLALIQSICHETADRGAQASCAARGRLLYSCRYVAMRRCLTNLIENAVKYGGQAAVSVQAKPAEIVIHIDDLGPGIPDELREDVFRPFYRIEESRNRDSGGVGLGLTVARTVARAHGGDVVLTNRPQGGLRATLTLPIVESDRASDRGGKGRSGQVKAGAASPSAMAGAGG